MRLPNLGAALLAVLLYAPSVARADDAGKLESYEKEVQQIGANLPKPGKITTSGGRRLVDAQTSYALGDYDAAALVLFDLAARPGPDQETANFYLGESLYQKGDRGAARHYYEHVTQNPQSRYYQQSLIRLVEIAISQQDTTDIQPTLDALERLAPGARRPDVPYVLGKYAFFQGKYDEALAYLQDVPKESSMGMQATYYSATVNVAKKDLVSATQIFTRLTNERPKTPNDRRVIELSHMALGRLYYERDLPSKSIDSYLEIDRHSDLFPDALYEVAWVYVKGKQFDKALRALELLSLSEPNSTKTATVRILEGNLRIRKAQMIRDAKITNTLDASNRDSDPNKQYDKAEAVFTETHDLYLPSYRALAEMVDNPDPGQFLQQLAGRTPRVFSSTPPVPEAAAQYLRNEPEVQRVVAVQTDLNEVETIIANAEQVISRLEAVLAVGDKTALYPALQSRRDRLGAIQDDLIKIRIGLHDQLATGANGASGNRRTLASAYAALGSVEKLASDKAAGVRAGYDKIDESASEVTQILDSTQAIAVALRNYTSAKQPSGEPMPDDQKTTMLTDLDSAATEAAAIDRELQDVQKEIQLGRDLARVGDPDVAQARETRKQLIAALDAEYHAIGSGGGATAQLAERAMRLSASIANLEAEIDRRVEDGMNQVRQQIVTEKAEIASMKTELDANNDEARSLGGTVLASSFKSVKDRFYEIVVRTDVGNIDVAWSRKEDNDDDLKRLNLARARDLKQLKDEFREVLENPTPTSHGRPLLEPPSPTPAPAAPPTTSPDKAAPGTDTRVKPGGEGTKQPPKPVVKPDAKKAGGK